jgi:hypothetical protein
MRFLTADQKQQHVSVCDELRQIASKERAGFMVMTLRQEHAYNFSLMSVGLFTEILSWQAKQSILHTTMTFYSDSVKMCKDFLKNVGDKRAGCCIMTSQHLTLFFSPGNFWPKTT